MKARNIKRAQFSPRFERKIRKYKRNFANYACDLNERAIIIARNGNRSRIVTKTIFLFCGISEAAAAYTLRRAGGACPLAGENGNAAPETSGRADEKRMVHILDSTFSYTGRCTDITVEVMYYGRRHRDMYILSMEDGRKFWISGFFSAEGDFSYTRFHDEALGGMVSLRYIDVNAGWGSFAKEIVELHNDTETFLAMDTVYCMGDVYSYLSSLIWAIL